MGESEGQLRGAGDLHTMGGHVSDLLVAPEFMQSDLTGVVAEGAKEVAGAREIELCTQDIRLGHKSRRFVILTGV